MKSNHEKTVVLGAGVTALSVAYHSKRSVDIYESGMNVGGLCRTLHAGGYLLDFGVHTLFTSIPYVARLYMELVKGGVNSRDSIALVYHDGTYVDFPFQANLWQVSGPDRERFLSELIQERRNPRPVENYRDWLITSFGKAMAESFMIPYNEKKYRVDLRELDADPFSSKNPVPSIDEIEAGAKGPQKKVFGHNPRWQYPARGGFQALVNGFLETLRDRVSINYRRKAVQISPSKKKVFFEDGSSILYDRLVVTMPLDQAVAITEGLEPEISRSAHLLTQTGVRVFSFGLKGTPRASFHWAYYAHPDIPFLRLSQPSFFAEDIAPKSHHLIQAEVTDSTAVIETVEKAMEEVGAIETRDNIVFRHVLDLPYAYPHQSIVAADGIPRITEAFRERDIFPLGRFGSWGYLDADRCIIQGKEFADTFLN